MRFPEGKIKEAILHPDLEIRDRATSYFAKSYSHGRFRHGPRSSRPWRLMAGSDAYRLIGPSRDLPQTEETIAWVIDELNDDPSDQYENYTYNLSMVLVEADPALLLPRESDDPGGPPLPARARAPPSPSGCGCSPGTRRPAGGSWRSSARRGRTSRHATKSTWAMPTGSWKPWLVTARNARRRSMPCSDRRWRITATTR